MRYLSHPMARVMAIVSLCWASAGLAEPSPPELLVDDPGFGVEVSNAYLENQSGMAGSAEDPASSADLSARLNDNIVYSSVNGNNNIGKGAFADTIGFPTVIQNSGNNVIIQNNTILNVTLQQ
ncbi:MAG: hypothetical protein ACOY4D_03755 [Pseudomonadota bacterium]